MGDACVFYVFMVATINTYSKQRGAQFTVISAVGVRWPVSPVELPDPWSFRVGRVGSRGSLLWRAPGPAPPETTAAAGTTGPRSVSTGTAGNCFSFGTTSMTSFFLSFFLFFLSLFLPSFLPAVLVQDLMAALVYSVCWIQMWSLLWKTITQKTHSK